MFWKISEFGVTKAADDFTPVGRFVLQRHTDVRGEHLDLRLEAEGHLRGWRIDAASLAPGVWATEKPPHPLRWLDDSTSPRVDAGEYAVERWGNDGGALILRGAGGSTRVVMMPAPELPVSAARAIAETLHAAKAAPEDASRLIADGLTARSRATERLCGLARELDGEAFEERVWRRTLVGLSLEEIHAQLRAFEVRFDAKYPPLPVSRPEMESGGSRVGEAMAIARE